MTVAAAIMAVQAMAMAPVIGDVPSPVVGDAEVASPANTFVWPDAFNLANYVTDDSSPSASIIWSFTTAGTSLFAINGHDKMTDLSAGALINPGANAINTSVVGGEVNPDSNAATLTIRDVHLTPLGSTTQGLDPGSGDSQVVTLFASDGSTYSQKDVMFYAQHGNDHLSQSGGVWLLVINKSFNGGVQGWTTTSWGGTISFPTNNNTAICLNLGLTGSNAGFWTGPYGELSLVKNNVYRIRMTMVGSQSGAGAQSDVPFWEMIVNNYTGTQGLNQYGLNYFILDNTGRANAVTTTAREFQAWWCPSSVSAPQWNDEAATGVNGSPYSAANAANKDGFLQFRSLDSPGGGTTGEFDQGSVCIDDLTIERQDIAGLSLGAPLYNATNITDGRSSTAGNPQNPSILLNTTATFSGGAVTVGAANATQEYLGALDCGDANLDQATPSTLPDNFPVALQPQKGYLITYMMAAPTAADASNPPDAFWIGADTPTNELICLSYVATGGGNLSAMPKSGTPQAYKALFWSNYGTAASNPAQYAAFRPRFMFVGANTLGGTATNNSGKITISGIKVEPIN